VGNVIADLSQLFPLLLLLSFIAATFWVAGS
jgi:hypothetical protein